MVNYVTNNMKNNLIFMTELGLDDELLSKKAAHQHRSIPISGFFAEYGIRHDFCPYDDYLRLIFQFRFRLIRSSRLSCRPAASRFV